MSLARITQLLHAAGARRLSSQFSLWHLARPWWRVSRRARRFEELRAEILANVLELGTRTFLVITVNPQESDVGGPWAHAGRDTWVVPANCQTSRLMSRLLGLGSWQLYAAPLPVEASDLPNGFRGTPAQVADFALGHSISVLIQAGRNNHPWRVWVDPTSRQHEVAA
jgi:hypothetical protein